MTQPRLPVCEALDFDDVSVAVGIAGGAIISVSGTQPDSWQVFLDDDEDPSIPEPEFLRWRLVGCHAGEYVPSPTPFVVRRGIDHLPPGCRGIEIVGKTRSEQVRVSV